MHPTERIIIWQLLVLGIVSIRKKSLDVLSSFVCHDLHYLFEVVTIDSRNIKE